jgi:hypothetical protein
MVSKKSNTGLIKIPDLKLFYRTITIKIVLYLKKNRQEDQGKRIHREKK